jgi:hypothetical protein
MCCCFGLQEKKRADREHKERLRRMMEEDRQKRAGAQRGHAQALYTFWVAGA